MNEKEISMSAKDLAGLNAMLIQLAFQNKTLMVLCRSGWP